MRFAPRAGGVLTAITLALGLAALPTPAYAAPITCDEAAFPKVPVPFYNGTAWFLPFGGACHKAKDRLL